MSSIFPNTETTTNPAEDVQEKVEINLDEEVEVKDPEGDVNERLAPPPASKLQAVRWSLGEKGIVPSIDKNKKTYLAVYLDAEILGVDGFDGFKIKSHYINSIMRGVTSDVHHFMNSIGEPLPKMKLGEMKERIEQALAQNPTGYVEDDWRCGYLSATEVDKNNKPKFIEQCIRMDQFPLIDDPENPGKKIRSHVTASKKDGEPLFAQLYIRQILSPAEVAKRKGGK